MKEKEHHGIGYDAEEVRVKHITSLGPVLIQVKHVYPIHPQNTQRCSPALSFFFFLT